jgi:hypothetical protein
MKKLLIIILLSFNINAHADVFDDLIAIEATAKAPTPTKATSVELSSKKSPTSLKKSAFALNETISDRSNILKSFIANSFKYTILNSNIAEDMTMLPGI